MQARGGELIDALTPNGLVAERDGHPIGLVCWRLDPGEAGPTAEITCLVVASGERGAGVGRRLLDAAAAALRERRVRRAWLVTTNDNLAALALYQKAGFRLSALRPGAVAAARRALKPGIPAIGEHEIPLRDELELGLDLTS